MAAPDGAGAGWEARVRRNGATEAMRFDALVATDRAMAPVLEAAAPDIAGSMRAAAQGAAPSFALMLELATPLEGAPDGIFVAENPVLSWLSKESSKPKRRAGRDGEGAELWTAHSSAEFAKLVVQEHGMTARGTEAHDAALEHVTSEMLAAVREVTQAAGWGKLDLLTPPSAHRWGNAFPGPCGDAAVAERRVASSPCGTLVACGDWAAPEGQQGRVEAAYLSGEAAAGALLASLATAGAGAKL